MIVIEVSESTIEKMSQYAEEMLKYGGKLMTCLDELSSENYNSDMGERNHMGERRYDNRSNYRDNYERGYDYDRDYDRDMGERRGVRGTGMYSRYR